VLAVLAPADVCDQLAPPVDVSLLRVAPREVMLVGPAASSDVSAVVGEAGLVVDVSDGWVGLVLEGVDAPAAFARISELELPDRGWVQGEVARAAAKVLVEPGHIAVLVPAMLAAHVEQRIRIDAAEVLAS
jgi:hypothetical protein